MDTKKQWLAQAKAWCKTQENSIASCDLAIKHAKEQIKNLQASIRLEGKEKAIKVKLYNDFKKQMATQK